MRTAKDSGVHPRLPSSESSGIPLGVHREPQGLRFTLKSAHAEKVQLLLFAKPMGEEARMEVFLQRLDRSTWSVLVSNQDLEKAGNGSLVLYGYRVWGPNWKYVESWEPGSDAGFIRHVDGDGNRFNPNKVLFDPYALELTHDPLNLSHRSGVEYASGSEHYLKDNALVAPKGIYSVELETMKGHIQRVSRPLKDEIIYEAHIKGLTQNFTGIKDPKVRGTYKGAIEKIPYLKELGITAIQFLPIQETQNDQNDIKPDGDDPVNPKDHQYWGYMTLNFFAPDRRYSYDKSPGGPTREFRDMVRAFHEAGIKVYLDVVYNHTGEGGLWEKNGQKDINTANLLSYRGIDNQSYYHLAKDREYYFDNTGCGHNINATNPIVGNLVLDSLKHWRSLGVDGFRFDLASVLGNECDGPCVRFKEENHESILNRCVRELPGRDKDLSQGVDLIAEPWAIGDELIVKGKFPKGWAEWNGEYRDILRKKMNKLGYEKVTPGQLADMIGGSSSLYNRNGRKPYHSINFIVAHDGFTLRDLFSYNEKKNHQAYPNGPSDGGEEHNNSWDQGGSRPDQVKAVKNALTFLMLSSGTPMITAGDEQFRSQLGNNNAYNLDTTLNWLNWSEYSRSPDSKAIFDFSKKVISLRKVLGGLRRYDFFKGNDHNNNNGKDIAWLKENGEMQDSDFKNPDQHFIGYRLDVTEEENAHYPGNAEAMAQWGRENWKTLVVYFNFDSQEKWVNLPLWFQNESAPLAKRWKIVLNTAKSPNPTLTNNGQFKMESRSAIVFVEMK